MLSFDDYKKLAVSNNLRGFEKVGFNAHHRDGKEENIIIDIRGKLKSLNDRNKLIMDIGCGCSVPVVDLIHHCRDHEHKLVLVDSAEMLSNLGEYSNVVKAPHCFPSNEDFLKRYSAQVDTIICYSVLHAIYDFQNIFTFIDKALTMLAPGGEMLLGDIANISKKKRFLATDTGAEFHREWSGGEVQSVAWNETYTEIDDATIVQLFLRYRGMGFETFVLPQSNNLPLCYTREDLLIRRYL